MPKRRPAHRSVSKKKKQNITRAKARSRAIKAWRTKYQRYHFASEDPDYDLFNEMASGGGDFSERVRNAPGVKWDDDTPENWRSRESQQEKLIDEHVGPGRMSKSIGEIAKEHHEAESNKFMRERDILNDPEIKEVLASAARRGVPQAEIDNWLTNLHGQVIATRRQRRERLQSAVARRKGKEGDESYNFGPDTRVSKAMMATNALMRQRFTRRQNPEQMEAFVRDQISAQLGPRALPGEINTLTSAVLTYQLKQVARQQKDRGKFGKKLSKAEREARAEEEQQWFHDVRRLAVKVGQKIDDREERRETRTILTQARQEAERTRLRSIQSNAKWGQFGTLSYGTKSIVNPRNNKVSLTDQAKERSVRAQAELEVLKEKRKENKKLRKTDHRTTARLRTVRREVEALQNPASPAAHKFIVDERAREIENEIRRVVEQPWDPYGQISVTPRHPNKNVSGLGPRTLDTRSPEDMRRDESQARPALRAVLPVLDPNPRFRTEAEKRKYNELVEATTHGPESLAKRVTQDEITRLARDIAKHESVPNSPLSAQRERDIQERLDSLRIRTTIGYNPNALYNEEVQNLLGRYSTKPKKPQHKTVTAEEFYRDKERGVSADTSGLPWREKPKAKIKNLYGAITKQGKFVGKQKRIELEGIKSGDIYYGWQGGKRVNPAQAAYGVTANKHWRYRKKITGGEPELPAENLYEEYDPRLGATLIVKQGGEGGQDPARGSMTGAFPQGRLKGVGSSKFIDVPFGARTAPTGVADHELQRTFDDTLNVRLGSRKLNPEHEEFLPPDVDREVVIPLRSLKKENRRHVDTYKHVPDPDNPGEFKIKKERVRYRMVPYGMTQLEQNQADQFAVRIPGVGDKVGERAVFFNVNNMDSRFVANATPYLLGPARARQERKLREMQELQARLKEAPGGFTVDRQSRTVGGYEGGRPKDVLGYIKDVEEGRIPTNWSGDPVQGYMTSNSPEAWARAGKIMSGQDPDKKQGEIPREVATAAAMAAMYKTRKRFTHYSIPSHLNERAKALGRKHPKLGKLAEDLSYDLDAGMIDVKQGLWGPLDAALIDWKFRLRHPASSPSGKGVGIELNTGYYRQKGITADRRIGRKLKRERSRLQHMENVSRFFDQADSPNATRLQRMMRKRKDNVQIDKKFREFMDRGERMAFILQENKDLEAIDKINAPARNNFLFKKAFEFRRAETRRYAQYLSSLETNTAPVRQVKPWTTSYGHKIEFEGMSSALKKDPITGKLRPFVSPGNEVLDPAAAKFFRSQHLARQTRNKNLLIGGAVIGTALGAGYLYHKHREKKKAEEERQPYYSVFIPHKRTATVPYVRTIGWKRTPDHPILREFGVADRRIPNRFAAGTKEKVVWGGKPHERGYDRQLKLGIADLSLRRPKSDGKTTGKVFLDAPMQMKRYQDKGPSQLQIGGKTLPFDISLGQKRSVTQGLSTKNPNKMGPEERKKLARTFGLADYEYQPGFESRQRELQDVLAFYGSGLPDTQTLNALQSRQYIRSAKKDAGDLKYYRPSGSTDKPLQPGEKRAGRGSFSAQRSIRGKLTKKDERNERLSKKFMQQVQ